MDVNTQSGAGRMMEPAATFELGAVATQPSLAQSKRTVRNLVVKSLLCLAVLGDVIAVVAGLSLGYWIRFESGWIWFGTESGSIHSIADYGGLIAVGTAFMLATFVHFNIYDLRNMLRYSRTIKDMARSIVLWSLAYLGASLVMYFQPPISRIYVGLSCLSSFVILIIWRYLFAFLLHHEHIAKYVRERILFVGWGPEANRLAVHIVTDKNHPFTIVGWVPGPRKDAPVAPPRTIRLLGDYSSLSSLLRSESVDTMVLADMNLLPNQTVDIYNECEKAFVQFKKIPSHFQVFTAHLQLETVAGVPLLGVSTLPQDHEVSRALKRLVDILGAMVGLILSAPIMAVCGWLIHRESPGTIFYRQVRMGKNGRHFQIIKMRSMHHNAEADGIQWAKKNDLRRLKIGAFMRKWNLDEVPQFWNVLKGEMSLVGPRPERPELVKNFLNEISHYNSRHIAKPGMTGWAQINGYRGDTDLTERIRCDLYYLENWSLWLDLQIMFQTFYKLKNAY